MATAGAEPVIMLTAPTLRRRNRALEKAGMKLRRTSTSGRSTKRSRWCPCRRSATSRIDPARRSTSMAARSPSGHPLGATGAASARVPRSMSSSAPTRTPPCDHPVHRRRHGHRHGSRARLGRASTRVRVARFALAFAIVTVGCRDAGKRVRERPPAVEHVIGSGPAPLFPTQIAFASELRPSELVGIAGTGLAAASGQLATGPALQLIDIDAARVVWTDTTACMGKLVHATAERLVCANGRGVSVLDGKSGAAVWSSERTFFAAHGELLLLAGAVVQVSTGPYFTR